MHTYIHKRIYTRTYIYVYIYIYSYTYTYSPGVLMHLHTQNPLSRETIPDDRGIFLHSPVGLRCGKTWCCERQFTLSFPRSSHSRCTCRSNSLLWLDYGGNVHMCICIFTYLYIYTYINIRIIHTAWKCIHACTCTDPNAVCPGEGPSDEHKATCEDRGIVSSSPVGVIWGDVEFHVLWSAARQRDTWGGPRVLAQYADTRHLASVSTY